MAKLKDIVQKALEPSFFGVIVLKSDDKFECYTVDNRDLPHVLAFLEQMQTKRHNNPFANSKET